MHQQQPRPAQPGYVISSQHGQAVNNVTGHQYYSPIQQVVQQRDGFLREIAATKTRARWLAWTGFLGFIAGNGTFGYGFYQQIRATSGPGFPTTAQDNAGLTATLIGMGVAFIGIMLLIAGIVLHVVAAARRRRVERDFPLAQPWPETRPAPGRTP
jgi:hypothetical protein